MEKKKKFKPKDSSRQPPERKQAITEKANHGRRRTGDETANPAVKRKFSEQPPTKHNSKT